MTEYVTGFTFVGVGETYKLFNRLLTLAEQVNGLAARTAFAADARAILTQYEQAFRDFVVDLRSVGRVAASQAQRDIEQRVIATQVRSDTDNSPHLRTLIRCRPRSSLGSIPTGEVGIADVKYLERAINHRTPGYGTYWRAQEYGTGKDGIPSQLGRILFGYFAAAGGGDLTPPQAQYAGGGGPHPIFLSTVSGTFGGPLGGRGGIGTIRREIQPRRFIALGKDAAAGSWRREIDAIQQRAITRLGTIGLP